MGARIFETLYLSSEAYFSYPIHWGCCKRVASFILMIWSVHFCHPSLLTSFFFGCLRYLRISYTRLDLVYMFQPVAAFIQIFSCLFQDQQPICLLYDHVQPCKSCNYPLRDCQEIFALMPQDKSAFRLYSDLILILFYLRPSQFSHNFLHPVHDVSSP